MTTLFARNDSAKEYSPMFRVSNEEAREINLKGFGVFHAVNEFHWERIQKNGKGRTIENISKINYWTVESDSLSIDEQLEKINDFCSPTQVIRSKKSLHVYWGALNGTLEAYRTIQEGLCKIFCGDAALKNPAQVLRAPGFYHMKNPNDPFLVESIFKRDIAYKQESLYYLLERRGALEKKKPVAKKITTIATGDGFFSRLDSLNQGDVLLALNGKLSGDLIELKRGSGRNKNIWVNGKSTEAFVDAEGKIGSSKGGGPTALQWVKYYGYSTKDAIEILKQTIPTLGETNE